MQRSSGNWSQVTRVSSDLENLRTENAGASPLETHNVDGAFHFPNGLHAKK